MYLNAWTRPGLTCITIHMYLLIADGHKQKQKERKKKKGKRTKSFIKQNNAKIFKRHKIDHKTTIVDALGIAIKFSFNA